MSLLVSEFVEESTARAARLLPPLRIRARVLGDADAEGPEISVNKLDMPYNVIVAFRL